MFIRAKRLGLGAVGGVLLAGLSSAWAAEHPAKLAAAGAIPASDFALATEARVGGDESQTRFVVDLSRKIDLRAFTLADPFRAVVDLSQVTFQLPAKTGESGRGLIKAFRYGLIMQGGSRIVLDLTRPARIDKAFVLDPVEGQPARLVLELSAIDRDSFMRTLALDRSPPKPEPQVREAAHDAGTDARPLVVLDPGHGGIDSGTHASSGDAEKAIVLEFALLLRDSLEKTGKFRTVMTRTDDHYVTLGDRVRLAHGAALLISIHADALPAGEGDAQGASVYTLSDTASDAEAARLAEVENKADMIAGVDLAAEPDDVAGILIDLTQRETKGFSTQFARTLVGELKSAARLHKNPLKAAGFKVLKSADVPSVLVELGYVSNRQDLKLMKSEAWRLRTVNAMVQAVDSFFAKRFAGAGSNGGPN